MGENTKLIKILYRRNEITTQLNETIKGVRKELIVAISNTTFLSILFI